MVTTLSPPVFLKPLKVSHVNDATFRGFLLSPTLPRRETPAFHGCSKSTHHASQV